MATTKKSYRLSEHALSVIRWHQERKGFVCETEAVEDIITKFFAYENKVAAKFKRFLAGDPDIKPLETFTHAP
jgi:hypothetical protein